MSEILEYKCPACGGALEFDSSLQKMKCPYCDSVIDVKDLLNKDKPLDEPVDPSALPKDDFHWNAEGEAEWSAEEADGMSVFVCKSCGGEIIGDKNMAATACPYCGNNVIIAQRFQGALKPDFVIPFKLDREKAKEQYRKHIEKKFLLPKEFKSENHIDEIKGIYVPFWIFDSKVDAYARFEAENVRVWEDARYRYTEHTYYDVFRSGKMAFAHIPVDGSSKMPDDLMESIEPFDFSEAVPFQTAYLAGFFSDKYDVDKEQSEKRANERLRQSTMDILQGTIGHYDSLHPMDGGAFRKKISTMSQAENYSDPFAAGNTASNGVKMEEGKVKYAMYPVYMMTTTYQGQKYTFAMNGQTGRFVGNLPIDKGKRLLTFLGTFAGSAALIFLLINMFLR